MWNRITSIFLVFLSFILAHSAHGQSASRSFVILNKDNGLPSDRLTSITTDPNGQLWIGTNGAGLVQYDGAEFIQYLDHGYFIQDVQLLHDTLFLASERGHYFMTGQTWKSADAPPLYDLLLQKAKNTPALNHLQISGVEEGSTGEWWLATKNNGLLTYSPITEQLLPLGTLSSGNVLADLRLSDICIDQNGEVWITTENHGLARYIGETFQFLQGRSQGEHVKRIFVGNNDAVQSNRQITDIIDLQGYESQEVVDVLLVPPYGRIVLDQNGAVFHIKSLDSIELMGHFEFGGEAQKIVKSGNAYFILTNNGVFKAFMTTVVGRMLPIWQVEKILDDRTKPIQDIFSDERENVWILTNAQVGLLKNDKVHWKKMPPNFQNAESWFLDDVGFLWIATANAGLYSGNIEQSNFELKQVEKPFNNQWPEINNLLVLGDQIYITDRRKIYALGVSRKRNRIVSWKMMSKATGLPNIIFSPNAIAKNRGNRIFIGTDRGILEFKNQNSIESPRETGAEVYIKSIEINAQPLEATRHGQYFEKWFRQNNQLVLSSSENNLHIRFGAKGLNTGKLRLFQWRMDENSGWSELSDAKNLPLRNLGVGEYNIQIRSCHTSNQCGDILTVPIRKLAPIYLRPWFIILAAGIFIGLLWYGIRQRIISVKEKLLAEKERLELKTNALELERKALQLQMNPHFIFNAINAIQSKIGSTNNEEAKSHLAKFSKLMRGVLESSRMPSITLEDEIELLKEYADIAGLSAGVNVDFKAEIAENIETEFVEIPSMLIQPFIENAILHGFKGRQHGTIIFKAKNHARNGLMIDILDDGHGLTGNQRPEGHVSISTKVIRERLALLPIPGRLEIKNRTDGTGTHVTVVFNHKV